MLEVSAHGRACGVDEMRTARWTPRHYIWSGPSRSAWHTREGRLTFKLTHHTCEGGRAPAGPRHAPAAGAGGLGRPVRRAVRPGRGGTALAVRTRGGTRGRGPASGVSKRRAAVAGSRRPTHGPPNFNTKGVGGHGPCALIIGDLAAVARRLPVRRGEGPVGGPPRRRSASAVPPR